MIGGALTAFLWVQWGELYCSLDEEVMEACVPSSAVVVIGAALLAIGLPPFVSGVFVALIPLVSGVLMLIGRGEEGLAGRDSQRQDFRSRQGKDGEPFLS